MGIKMGIIIFGGLGSNGGIWVLGHVWFLDLLDILVWESKGITWEWEIWGAEHPKRCEATSEVSKTLPRTGNFNCLIKNMEWFRLEGTFKIIPLPFLDTPQPLNILGIPNLPWAGTNQVPLTTLANAIDDPILQSWKWLPVAVPCWIGSKFCGSMLDWVQVLRNQSSCDFW